MARRVRSVRWIRMTHASVVARFQPGVVVYSTRPPLGRMSRVRSVDATGGSGRSSVDGEARSAARRASFESVAGSGRVRQYFKCAGK